MKPRHLKNKNSKNQNDINANKNLNKSNDPFINPKSELFSNLIPFHKTPEYYDFLDWIKNWKQSQPACILYGPTSCGKSTIIRFTSKELLCHVIEIDCASISGIKELVSTFHEATESRSVGIFYNHDNSNYDDAISMVVLEHVDSIISFHNSPPNSIITMISKSRVPLVMTSQYACLNSSEWLKIIPVAYQSNPYSIIKSAHWIKNSISKISTNQTIHSLLSFTDQDIRQTSLQYQVWRDDSNSVLTRDQQIYLSIPLYIQEIQDPKERREFYADFLDFYNTINHEDPIFNSYIRPISNTFESHHREQMFRSYVNFAQDKVKHSPMGSFEDLDLTEIVYQACLNDIPVTRNSTRPAFSSGCKIKSNEIQYVKSWDLWPFKERDIKNDIETNEIKSENADEIKSSQIENNEKNETEAKIEKEHKTEPEAKTEPKSKPEPEKKSEAEPETPNTNEKNEEEEADENIEKQPKRRGRRGRGRGRSRKK